ncbi:MAG: DNA polymerase [Desulfobacterales bacterium]|nr:DNA polymerase [Desulfobacterales bacterium]
MLLSADYSQIELRVLAHLSGDEALIEAFAAGEDIHTRTASDLFGVFPEMVSAEHAPAGQGHQLRRHLRDEPLRAARRSSGSARPMAKEYIDNYFDSYTGVRRFLDEILENARRDKYVCTLLNRRRYMPEIASSNAAIRQFAERTAINAPDPGHGGRSHQDRHDQPAQPPGEAPLAGDA